MVGGDGSGLRRSREGFARIDDMPHFLYWRKCLSFTMDFSRDFHVRDLLLLGGLDTVPVRYPIMARSFLPSTLPQVTFAYGQDSATCLPLEVFYPPSGLGLTGRYSMEL